MFESFKSAKRSTFGHKVGQNLGFCWRVKGCEVNEVHLLGPKGSSTSPISILVMGLLLSELISQCVGSLEKCFIPSYFNPLITGELVGLII